MLTPTLPTNDVRFDTLESLGSRVRALRTAKKMTLQDLSARTQVSVAMLSQIERGQTSPSLKTLERIRLGLGVQVASFFEPEASQTPEDDTVVRAHRRPQLPFKKLGLTKELLSPPGRLHLEVLMLVIDPNGSSGPDPWTRAGEKAGLVLDGRIELRVGERQHVLEAGDSFQFDSRHPHSFRNLSAEQTHVVWIVDSDEPG